MFLQFEDKSQIEVKSIFGSYKLIHGVLRDTLRIEIDPDTTSFDELCETFKDNPKTSTLYSVQDPDDNGYQIVTKIGEGYNVFVSISNERVKKNSIPGSMEAPVYEDIFVVQIAQQTYAEYILENSQEG
jgi:hypothetical protein